MNAAQLLVLIAATGVGALPLQAQPSNGATQGGKPSASWKEPGGPRPPEIAGKQNAALLYYQAWDSIDLGVFEQVRKRADSARVPSGLVAVLQEHQKFVDAVLRAAATPDCDWGPDYSAGPNALLPHLGHLRNTARLLGTDAKRCMEEGDAKGAAKRLVAVVQMSNQVKGDRVLISALVGTAINQHARNVAKAMMDDRTLTPEGAHMLMAAFKSMPEDPFGFGASMATERELGLEWIRNTFSGPDAGRQLSQTYFAEGNPPGTVAAVEKLNGDELKAQLDRTEVYYDELEKLWCQEGKEKEFAALEKRLEKGEFGVVAMVIAPSLSKANASYLKSRTAMDEFIKELAEYIRNWKPAGEGSGT